MTKVRDELKELRNLKDAELQRRASELRDKLRDMAFKTRGDEVKNVHETRSLRKQIARILTVLNNKQR